MTAADPPPIPQGGFEYEAQSAEGIAITGVVETRTLEDAQSVLQRFPWRLLQLRPRAGIAKLTPLRAGDFAAFNQQLAHLTAAGLPIEQGLRLMAQDMPRRLGSVIAEVSADLEKGIPLPEAFNKRRGQFPALYSTLIDAGIRASNLPAMLLSLNTHLELVQRLKVLLWRTTAYPLAVLAAALFILTFMSYTIFPQFEHIFSGFSVNLPSITQFVIALGHAAPYILVGSIVVILILPLLWTVFRALGQEQAFAEAVIYKLPGIGGVLKRNLIARWCDLVAVAVEGGIDLPNAIATAGNAMLSPRLQADSSAMIAALESGRPLDQGIWFRMLPATVPAVIQLASERNDLATALRHLSRVYQQQAELKASLVPSLITPIFFVALALLFAVLIIGLFAPMINLLESVSSPKHW